MEPIAIERPLRSGPEPHVVVDTFRGGTVFQVRRLALPVQIRPATYQAHAPQLAAVDVLLGGEVLRPGALLSAHLDDPLVLASRVDHLAPFPDRDRQRLFDIHVLARLAGLDRGHGMPVVGGRHDDGIDVTTIQDAPEVLRLQFRFLLERSDYPLLSSSHLGRVDIA